MTKIDARTKQVAARQIAESPRRLQVETNDLLQFHEVIRPQDADLILARDRAIEAALETKKAGKIRDIGFTGHDVPLLRQHPLKPRMGAVIPFRLS